MTVTSITNARVDRVPVRHNATARDLAGAEQAAVAMLTALGVDLKREGMAETPGRMVRALAEMCTPRDFDLTTFPNEAGYDQLVIERRIRFQSLCEHHLLPFTGFAYVAYLPGTRILGLSKLARVVELFACQPQVQEQLTQQIADWLRDQLKPKGVGVVLDAEHMCMTLRGARAEGSTTVTSALHGLLLDDLRAREEFFLLAKVGI
ncbi:GTP cyclohydrolase I [Nonomuraea sp. M3C6]|uniref:GTP cyclohydrolase 1 n=1 Tax=Nonomuraea marmarensis TaxID=3351344 RepID=A0ABW7AJ87_9ACTN